MNLLFYHGDETCPTKGGIQRTTALIAHELSTRYNYKCFNIYDYSNRYPKEVPRYQYEESIYLHSDFSSTEIAKIIDKYNIDVIINQQGVSCHSRFNKGIKEANHPCKLYYFHHTTPNRLFNYSFYHIFHQMLEASSITAKIKLGIKSMGYPIYSMVNNIRTLNRNARLYRTIYAESDAFILLAKSYINEWAQLTKISDLSKLKNIPNALSFTRFADQQIINNKEKRVLIVARMEEFPKQIIQALKIWKEICKYSQITDWTLDIVGDGPDLNWFKDYALKHNIGRVNFHGRQNSEPFYQRTSIFMMTSIREGWPMTLLESQQYGVVPIAFNSFGAVSEIIADGKTGRLIPPFDSKSYIEALIGLMTDHKLREKIALAAVEASKQYTIDKVILKWNDLLTK